ncbi:interferon gamma receptor 1 [Cheilinus undulatus]|uniref:interferon gamma receptor 1 n=1 Tax=Cheilinus undulatus TaxID=241271 RepID=UPI001BD3E1DD|nr:interferon gamma receptor 1 [Cheilinus undulatus]XP_041642259.1 interferon gamma receptor 1 [Cheilinus undulatus]
MPLDGAFTALLVLIGGVSAGIVPPPTGLTVSCENLNVTARWRYLRQDPNTRFRLHISGDAWDYTNETSDHHYDLTPFVWKSEEHYMGVHSVNVTAILGENQSRPVASGTFTFNDLRTANIKCQLAFPPVDLKVDDLEATVTFTNPFHFYPELKLVKKPYFEFWVTTVNGEKRGECLERQKTCLLGFLLPEDEDQCVTLKGRLYNGIVHFLVFNETGSICLDTPADFHGILLIFLLLGVFIVVSVITACICLTKSWTFKKEEPGLPTSLNPPADLKKQFFTQKEEDYSAVVLIENTPMKSSSMSSEDGGLPASGDESEAEGLLGSVGPYADGNCLENSDQQLEPGDSREDNSGDDSVKTEIILIDVEEGGEEDKREEKEEKENVDWLWEGEGREEEEEEEEETERSPYDSPHNLPIYQKR